MLIELFSQLDSAVQDMNDKLKTFTDLNEQTNAAYQEYLTSRKEADAIRADIQKQLGSIIPADPGRSRVS